MGFLSPFCRPKRQHQCNPVLTQEGKKKEGTRERAHMETLSLMAVEKNSNELCTITARIQPSPENTFEKDGKDHRRDKSGFHVETWTQCLTLKMFLNIQKKSDVQMPIGYHPTEIGLVLLFHQSLNTNQSCPEVFSRARGL